MAKKKQNVVIKDEELTPTVLATIENKKNNLLGLVILFVIFGAVVYFLPDITNYVEGFLNPEVKDTKTNNNVPTDNNQEEETVTVTKYEYSNDLVIDIEKFSLSNFSIVENKLNFTLNNKTNGILTMDNYNYYLEIYSETDTLIERIKLDDISVGSNISTELQYDLTAGNVSYFTLMEIKEEDYTAFTAPANDNGEATLVCTKDNEKINYMLKDNKLYLIQDHFEVSNLDENYNTLLSTYQSLAATYNSQNGVTSSVNIETDKLIFSTYIDLSVNSSVNINKIVYPKDTDAKIMRFELSSKGYTCD